MKPPFIRLYIKDFAFDIQDMSNEQLGLYMRSFLLSYKSDKIPKEKSSDSLFKELKNSSEQYLTVCNRNRKNRLKTKTNKNDWSTTGQPLDDDSLTNNHEPITNNQELVTNSKNTDIADCKAVGIEYYMKHNIPDKQLPIEWGREALKITNWEDERIENEWEKFKDYWIAKPKDNKKKDWLATWRNWLRNNKEKRYG